MLFTETFRVALQSLWSNKMRSALTILGLVIGILSVVVITTLGNAAKADMAGAFSKYGQGKVDISLDWDPERPPVYRDYFSDDDIRAISTMENDVVAVSPELHMWTTIKSRDQEINMQIQGVNQDYHKVGTVDIIKGRFLNEEDILGRRNVIIIDEKTARNIFGSLDCVGEKITITTGWHTLELKIVGIDKLMDSAILNMAQGNYSYGYIPLTLASRINVIDRYEGMKIQAQEGITGNVLGEKVLNLLYRRNKEKEMYRVSAIEDAVENVNQGIGILTTVISGIAAISLIVGGIGIMNIMLVSVTERTREIGIRKAIGAKSITILLQFLVEAILLSVFGGGMGLFLGGIISFIIVWVLGLPFVISKLAIFMAFIFSMVVGVVFGVYPARRAAKLDPIDALRYE